MTAPAPSQSFVIAFLTATALHLLVIITVRLAPPARSIPPEAALEVILLAAPPPAPAVAVTPSALAAHTQTGAALAPPVIVNPSPPAPAASRAPPAPAPRITSAPRPIPPAPPPLAVIAPPEPEPDPLALPTAPAVTAAQILASQDVALEQLNRAQDTQLREQARRVRRHAISASTREFRYANYLGAWARKVERIGNLNYPPIAKEQHLSGSLILHVAIRADGSVDTISVVRSSGVPLLDQAARDIVKLAAPYAAFPPDIAAETDVIDIIRTWQFRRGGVLGWEASAAP